MTRFAPGTDLSGIDTLTGLPKGQSRRRSPRRGTVKGSRPRPPMPSPRPPMRGPRPPMRGPMPPRRSDGLSSDKERHALLIGGRRPPMRGGRPPMGMPMGMPMGGMPMGGMPMGGRPPMMGGPQMNPQMARQIMPPSQPGGEGIGLRNRGPVAPQRRTSPGMGSPVTSVQQRGPPPTIGQANSNALLNARNLRGA